MVVPDLLDHLRSAYQPGSDVGYDDLFEMLRTAPVLVLDDLGVQSSTPWAQEKLFQLINHRYNAQLPTVFTTNLDPTEFDARLQSRLTDGDALAGPLPRIRRSASPSATLTRSTCRTCAR